MGFLDDLKKSTGVGLTYGEHYVRAFEKGVLLGPSHYSDAAAMFETAAKKAAEANDTALQSRAMANAQLYGFLSTGKPQFLASLAQALAYVPEIEVIGSRSDSMPTAPLLTEIHARLVEVKVAQIAPRDFGRLADEHERAAAAFKHIFSAPLLTYRFQSADSHVDMAQTRFFLHTGLAAWNQAQAAVMFDPDQAADKTASALNAFRQCNDQRWIDEAQRWLANCRTKRTCWMCRREMQAAGIHFRTYAAELAPYVVERARAGGEDVSGLDVGSGIVVLCVPCGSVVERQADLFAARRADAVRAELVPQIAQLGAAVVELNARLTRIQIVGR
jgi:hypothetical protein